MTSNTATDRCTDCGNPKEFCLCADQDMPGGDAMSFEDMGRQSVDLPADPEPRPEAGPVAPKTPRARWDEGMPDRNGGGATSDAKQHEAWLWRDDALKSKPMARFIALEMHNVMTYELHRQKRSGEFGAPMPIANRMLEQRTGLSKQAVEHAVAWAVALGAFRRIDDRLGCKPGRRQGKGAAATYVPTLLNHR